MQTITAGLPSSDGCPVLTRLKAFLVQQGVVAKLRHIVRDRNGNPLDLSEYVPAPNSESGSDSDSDGVEDSAGNVVVRIKEFIGVPDTCRTPVYELKGTVIDATGGELEITLTPTVVAKAGIFEMNWGVKNADGDLVVSDRSLMSVERTLFASSTELRKNDGPPTIQEIRMWMMDSSPAENVLLDDVEFSDEQICLAMTKPVQMWNETLPPIRTFTTSNFPFRGAWVDGIMAELYRMAAAHYRRNRLQSSAAGVQTDSRNKEREYLDAAKMYADKYEEWLQPKKVSINMQLMVGRVETAYSSRSGW